MLELDYAKGGVKNALAVLDTVSSLAPCATVRLSGWDFSPKVVEASPELEIVRERLVALLEDGEGVQVLSLTNVQYTGRVVSSAMGARLEELEVCETIVSERDGLMLGALIANAPLLSSFRFSRNDSFAKAITVLCNKIAKSSSLTTLDFSYNSFMGFVGTSIGTMIAASGSQLKVINLGHNQLRSLGVRPIAKSLRKNVSLTSLNLADNHIDSHGVDDLVAALQANPGSSLVALDLSLNDALSQADVDRVAPLLRT